MKKRSAYRVYLRLSGLFFALLGLAMLLYILLLVSFGFWSRDLAAAVFALSGACSLALGLFRLVRVRPLLCFAQKGLRRLSQAAFALALACILALQTLILLPMGLSSSPGANAVLILGARVYGDTPSLLLSARIDAACGYLKENPDALAVACGGGNEADVIAAQLAARGVAPSRILLETQSQNTFENVSGAVELLKNVRPVRTLAVATSDYHLWRSMRLVRLHGLDAVPVGAATSAYLRPIAHFREMVSILRDLLLVRSA